MKSTSRRRARLRSSQYASERWKPSPLLLVLLAGALCGVLLGVRGRLASNSASLQEHYLLLVSDLYAQGAPLTAVQARLVAVGYPNPAASVLAVADQLASSRNAVQKQEADQLRQFSDALAIGDQRKSTVAVPTAQSAAPTPVAVTPTTAPLALVPATPVATSTPESAASPTSTAKNPAGPATDPPAPAPTSAPAPRPTARAGGKVGTVVTSDHKPVLVRRSPTTKSPAVAIAPYGAKVQVTGIVTGDAVVAGQPHWYHVSYSGHDGYIYVTLVKVEG